MKYNFDEIIDRTKSNSVKYTPLPGQEDTIPMWIADMDFKSPPEIAQATMAVAEHGVFGYTEYDLSYEQSACDWMLRNFNWTCYPKWNIRAPGIVFAISVIVRALVPPSGNVIVLEPVYFPFRDTVIANERNIIVSPLLLNDGKYDIDFADFEKKIKENDVKLFIQCSPHNPLGRVSTKEELEELGAICLRNKVKVISDEIHSDFVFPDYHHTVFAGISSELANISIICTAPSKTFNLAGLQASNIFVPNEELRLTIEKEFKKAARAHLNIFSYAGARAAYLYGQDWRNQLIDYLQKNLDFLRTELVKTNGKIKLIEPQGTYLMWLDCRELNLSDDELNDFFIKKAKLRLVIGAESGIGGSGFMRMNIACPKAIIEQATSNLLKALEEL